MIRASRVYRENNCRLIRRVIRSCGAIKSNDEPIKYLWNRMQARERALTPVFPPRWLHDVYPTTIPSPSLIPRGPCSPAVLANIRIVLQRVGARDSRRNPPTPHRTSSLDRDHSGSFFARCLVQRGPRDRENRGSNTPFSGDASKSICTVRYLMSCFQHSYNNSQFVVLFFNVSTSYSGHKVLYN